MKKHLERLFEKLWIIAPLALWFSYHPTMHFGSDRTMNYEVSLALVYVLVMGVVSMPIIWQGRRILVKQSVFWWSLAFVTVSLLSIVWSPNIVRGVLSGGVLGLVWLIFLASLLQAERLKTIIPNIERTLLLSVVLMAVWALWQVLGAMWLPSNTLLCAGCVADQFGFARPNGFMIEPQFFGGYVALAGLVAARRIMVSGWSWLVGVSYGLSVLALVLTLSRGAIVSFVVGSIILIVVYRHKIIRSLQIVGWSVATVLFALFFQGLVADLNPRFEQDPYTTMARSLHQLSLGIVDVRPKSETVTKLESSSEQKSGVETPAFDGYVEESTDIRLELSRSALKTWSRDLPTMAVGVGLGGAGTAMSQQPGARLAAKEIVQNEYFEMLLERGLVGFGLFIALVIGLFSISASNRWIWALIATFLVQILFFSGYPNALHAYMMLGIIPVISTVRRDQSQPARPC